MRSRRQRQPSSAEPWPHFHLATEELSTGPSGWLVRGLAWCSPAPSLHLSLHPASRAGARPANKRKQFRKDLIVCSAAAPLHSPWFTCLALKLHFGVSKSEKETVSSLLARPHLAPYQPRYSPVKRKLMASIFLG